MAIERLLQINVVAMVLLGTVLLGMGQRSPLLPAWMTAAALAAFWLTDVTGRFWLNRTMVNVGAVVALLLSLLGLRRFDGLMQVYVIANLLVYLQVVLLFQKKEMRVYWLLMLLSLMEVVVAAAFEQEIWFGILLFGYLFVGLAAMTFLYLHQEHVRRLTPEPVIAGPTERRWPLAGQEASFTSSPGGRAVLGSGLFFRMMRMTVAVAVIATVVFLFMPRLGPGGWRQAAGAPLSAVGFTDQVTLGELGRIIEDTDEVMRVRFVDAITGEPWPIHSSIYLRGAVLDYYERGKWGRLGGHRLGRHRDDYRQQSPVVVSKPEGAWARQEITIEPLDREELFCIWPFVLSQPDPRLWMDLPHQRLVRDRGTMTKRFSYQLLTPALRGNEQVAIVPYDSPQSPVVYLPPVPEGGPNGLPGLIALARQWVAQAAASSDSTYYRATALERQLRTAKQFRYSLEGQPRDSQLDPIEDFITKHRAGHCEYFATALVLMLRSQGIPARLVVGYKCDEWNELGQYYQIRQLHAHSWVEAYLGPRDIPDDVRWRFPQWNWADGGWLRLDPTPASDGLPLTSSLLVRADRYLSWLDYLWNNYIAEMNLNRQKEAIYRPAVQVVSDVGRNLLDPDWWRQFFSEFARRVHFESWFRWQVGLGLLGAIVVLAAAYRGLRRLLRPYLARWSLRGVRRARRRTPQVEFYRRLEAILAHHGLVRTASQTPSELAALARAELRETTGDPQVAQLPAQLVDAFYQVRFGRATLDRAQSQTVEQALRQLERALRSGNHEDRAGRLQGIREEHVL